MMGVSSSPFTLSPPLKASRCCYHHSPIANPIVLSKSPNPRLFSNPNLKTLKKFNRRSGVTCSSSSSSSSSSSNGTPGPGSGENDSKVVLDAFFLGKAFAEALNERIGSTVGEILSVVGQWQAEQQKQVQDFQEEVLERAKKAKEKAALEAMEDRGLISKSLPAPPDSTTPVVPSSSGPTTEDPPQEMLKD